MFSSRARLINMQRRANQLLMICAKPLERNIYDWRNSLYQNLKKYKSVGQYRKEHEARYHHDKNNIDFPVDESIGHDFILEDTETYNTPIQLGPVGAPDDVSISPSQIHLNQAPLEVDFESYPYSAQLGGWLDKYLPHNDFEDKTPDQLDFSQDYTENAVPGNISEEDLDKLMDKYLPAPPPGQFGLPDGVDLPDEDLGDPTNINPFWGTTDLGINMYEDKWNI